MYLQRGDQGNMMQAGAQFQFHSPGERWSWEFGGAGGRSALLLCSAAWVSSEEKEGGDLING